MAFHADRLTYYLVISSLLYFISLRSRLVTYIPSLLNPIYVVFFNARKNRLASKRYTGPSRPKFRWQCLDNVVSLPPGLSPHVNPWLPVDVWIVSMSMCMRRNFSRWCCCDMHHSTCADLPLTTLTHALPQRTGSSRRPPLPPR